MAVIPAPLIAPPLPLRRRYGIFDATPGPFDLPLHGEGGGVQYVPDTCGEAYVWGVNCYDPGESPDKPLDPDNEVIETGVFAVLATVLCSAVGYTREEYEQKARRRLESGEQAAVERALWSGLDNDGNTLDIRSIDAVAQAVTVPADPVIAEVVGALERYAYVDQGYGNVAYLHAPFELAALAAESGLVIPESTSINARKLTPGGSVWVFGAYPAGSIAVTGQVNVWRSVEVPVRQAFERETNEILTLAERTYAVSFDCFAGVAEYDPLEVTSP